MPLWLSALYYIWRMGTRAGLYICMWFLWAVLLGLDELNNQLTLYSLSFVFPGLQLSLNPQPSVCLQPDTMASLRPSQCEQSMWQVKQNLFYLLLDFRLQVIKKDSENLPVVSMMKWFEHRVTDTSSFRAQTLPCRAKTGNQIHWQWYDYERSVKGCVWSKSSL